VTPRGDLAPEVDDPLVSAAARSSPRFAPEQSNEVRDSRIDTGLHQQRRHLSHDGGSPEAA
jgi:hypothetical protein